MNINNIRRGIDEQSHEPYYLVWKRLKDGMCVAQCMLTAAPELD